MNPITNKNRFEIFFLLSGKQHLTHNTNTKHVTPKFTLENIKNVLFYNLMFFFLSVQLLAPFSILDSALFCQYL
jgi:hypothetical protein